MPIKYKNEVKYMGMFYECPMGENTPEDVTDKFNLRELVEFERIAVIICCGINFAPAITMMPTS